MKGNAAAAWGWQLSDRLLQGVGFDRLIEEEGVLIGLVQKKGRLFVGEYDEQELGIAVEGQIEVRG